jgi:hypothetical protein
LLGQLKVHKKSLIISLLSALLFISLDLTITDSGAQPESFQVSVAGTSVGSTPHQVNLKVTQLPGGQLSEVSGFTVSPEDVVQVKQGENLIVSTSPELQTHKVTAKNIQGIPIDMVQLPSNVWSTQGLMPGVYTLDVIVDMSSSGILGTYETILVVLAPNQKPVPPTTVINRVSIESREGCPTNSTLVNGTCQLPPQDGGPGTGNDTEPIICPMYIYYGKDPCAFDYIPPDENGECPEDHEFVNEDTGCVPESFLNPPAAIVTSPTPEPSPPTSPTPEPPPVDQEEGENGVEQGDNEGVSNGGGAADGGDENGGDEGDGGDGGGNGGDDGGGGGNLFEELPSFPG